MFRKQMNSGHVRDEAYFIVNFWRIVMSDHNNPPTDPTQLQGQAQGQLNAQGQLQGQGQLNAQGQGQGQGQLDLQGQGQGQGQGQAQDEAQYAAQGVSQAVSDQSSNSNGNLNGNGNGNLNGTGNFNTNDNHLDNSLSNGVSKSVDNAVNNTVTVDVSVTADVNASTPPVDNSINITHLDGILFQMPETVTQYVNGDGNNSIFDLNQVNNLVSDGHLDSPSVSFSVDGALSSYDSGLPSSVFSMSASAAGGTASADNATISSHDSSPITATTDASAPVTMDAFTQSIVMGANIQFNSASFNVVGHDSITTDGGAAMGSHGHS